MSTFASPALSPELKRGIADMGFSQPTPIQEDTIPPAIAGRDILGCAMTGSGKTAAFVLPILQQLLGKKRGTTRALVLTPTRELAAQITDHIDALARHTPLTGAAVIGGVAMKPQEQAFRRGADIIVATPGRLLDHFQYPYARLSGLEILVLDEADRMLDMGFLPDIRRVLSHLPKRRQTLFFSATLPPPIVALAKDMLDDPVAVNVDRAPAPAVGITQTVYPARGEVKPALLLELLNRGSIRTALVFTRTKHRANRLATFLRKSGVACERIHGNRSQNQRTEALTGFKNGRYQVLVATDIAARGIDIEALSHVVNFDVPNMPDSYIHRVGRTARAEMTGDAFTFVSADEEPDLRAIERALGTRLPRLELDGFDYDVQRARRTDAPRNGSSNGRRSFRGRGRVNAGTSRGRGRSGGARVRSRPTMKQGSAASPVEKSPEVKPAGSGYGRRPRVTARHVSR